MATGGRQRPRSPRCRFPSNSLESLHNSVGEPPTRSFAPCTRSRMTYPDGETNVLCLPNAYPNGRLFSSSIVDGCLPSDLATGSTPEIEEERRLLYVAMTRAKDHLHLLVPQRFFVHNQCAGDRHVYAQRTRFIPDGILRFFECRSWPAPESSVSLNVKLGREQIDIRARMRRMWS